MTEQNFCFSILALKSHYQQLAKGFAEDLKQHAPDVMIIIGTDDPSFFRDCDNVTAFALKKTGILHCYHDKRFVIEKALSQFQTVIQIDADTRLIESLPELGDLSSGLSAVHVENLIDHVQKYNPERLVYLQKLAAKFDVNLATVRYVGESLFAVSAEPKTASAFIHYWNLAARYLELHGIHAGEGNAIGLAAAKAGLTIVQSAWIKRIHHIRQHLNASDIKPPNALWTPLSRRIDYHYRLNRARAIALKDFDFYYR